MCAIVLCVCVCVCVCNCAVLCVCVCNCACVCVWCLCELMCVCAVCVCEVGVGGSHLLGCWLKDVLDECLLDGQDIRELTLDLGDQGGGGAVHVPVLLYWCSHMHACTT